MRLFDGGAIHFLDAGRRAAHANRITSHAIDGHANIITLQDDLPDWVQPGTWTDPVCMLPRHTVIRDCRFHDITSRGIKCSVNDCLIENCDFADITSPGVHITGEFDWEESTCPSRVTIRGCRFTRCDMQDLHGYFKPGAILVQPKDVGCPARVCRDIRVEDCAFTDCPRDAIRLYHTANATIQNCAFHGLGGAPVWHDAPNSDPPDTRRISG